MALISFLQEMREGLLFYPLSVSVILFSLLFLLRFIGSWSRQSNLPPSPPKLPLIGNLHQLGKLAHHSLRDLSQKYGPIMLLHFGSAPFVVVSSPAIAKEIFKDHDIVLANRPFTTAAKILLYGCDNISFAPYGELWRQMRKICIVDLLSTKRVQSFKFVREEENACMIKKISRSSLVGASIDLREMLITLSMDILCSCAFGQKYGDGEGHNRFAELPREMTILLGAFSFGDFFPSLGWMDIITGLVRRLKSTAQELDSFMEQVIEEHLTRRRQNDSDKEKNFVELLLQIQEDKTLSIGLTRDKIKSMILDMFIAGTETSPTVTEWALAELVKNPNVMKKAQEEVRRVIGKKAKVDEEDVQQMEYLRCVVKESLRLHPPGPTLLPRESSASINIGGYNIPSKTRVLVNAWAIQRDPKIWSSAEEFIPERFMSKTFDFIDQDFAFIPFGSGRRICPGISFGVAVVELALANLLYWFDWELPGGANKEGLDMRECFGLNAARRFPLHLVPIPHFT